MPPRGSGPGFATNLMNDAALMQPVASYLVSHSLDPAKRLMAQNANFWVPNVLPTFELLAQAHYQGRASFAQLRQMSFGLGIDLRDVGEGTLTQGWWRSVLEANRPVPDVATAIRWHRRGFIGDETYVNWMNRYGHIQPNRQRNYLRDSDPPDPGQILTLRNRNTIGDIKANEYLTWQGLVDPQVQEQLMSLRFVIPSPSDQIMFSVREAWKQDIVDRFQYDAEYPPEFEYWAARVGLGSTGEFTTADGVVHASIPWPKVYWRSHWHVPSPTQAYSMFHRLRPNRIDRYAGQIEGLRAFTFSDLQSVLAVSDYPVPFRPQLAAIAYALPRLIDMRNFIRYGIIDRTELIELFLDRGMSPIDAERLADLTIKQQRAATSKAVRRNARARVTEAYLIGLIDEDRLYVDLYRVLLEDPQEAADFNNLPPFAQVDTARGDVRVREAVAVVQFDYSALNVKKWIGMIRKKYISGGITRGNATARLNDLGVQPAAVIRYISEWDFERLVAEKHDTAAKLVRWYRHGLLSVEEMANRLMAIGYDDAAIVRITADANRDIALDLARAQERAARTAAQRERALRQQARAAEAERRRIQREMLALGTPTVLARWLCNGLITPQEVDARLTVMGRQQADIDRILEEAERCIAKKGGGSTNGTPPPPAVPEGEGGGQPPSP